MRLAPGAGADTKFALTLRSRFRWVAAACGGGLGQGGCRRERRDSGRPRAGPPFRRPPPRRVTAGARRGRGASGALPAASAPVSSAAARRPELAARLRNGIGWLPALRGGRRARALVGASRPP